MRKFVLQGIALVALILALMTALAATNAAAQTPPAPLTPTVVLTGPVPLETYAALDRATGRKLLEFERRIETMERVCCEGKTDCPAGCKADTDHVRRRVTTLRQQVELVSKEAFDAACARIEAELAEIAKSLGIIQVAIEDLPERIRPVIEEELEPVKADLTEIKELIRRGKAVTRCAGEAEALRVAKESDLPEASLIELAKGVYECLKKDAQARETIALAAIEEGVGATITARGTIIIDEPEQPKGISYWECFLIGTGASVAVGGGTWLGTYLADCDPAFQATLAGSLAAGGAVISALACIPAAR